MAALSATSLRGVPKAKTDLLGKKHCALWSGKKKKKKKTTFRECALPILETHFGFPEKMTAACMPQVAQRQAG